MTYYIYDWYIDGVYMAPIEPQVEYVLTVDEGGQSVELEVTHLFLRRMGKFEKCNMLTSKSIIMRTLGEKIKRKIEKDADWILARVAEAGWSMIGEGPEARWQ